MAEELANIINSHGENAVEMLRMMWDSSNSQQQWLIVDKLHTFANIDAGTTVIMKEIDLAEKNFGALRAAPTDVFRAVAQAFVGSSISARWLAVATIDIAARANYWGPDATLPTEGFIGAVAKMLVAKQASPCAPKRLDKQEVEE